MSEDLGICEYPASVTGYARLYLVPPGESFEAWPSLILNVIVGWRGTYVVTEEAGED